MTIDHNFPKPDNTLIYLGLGFIKRSYISECESLDDMAYFRYFVEGFRCLKKGKYSKVFPVLVSRRYVFDRNLVRLLTWLPE